MRHFAILLGVALGLGGVAAGYSQVGALAQTTAAKPPGTAPAKPPDYGASLTLAEAINAVAVARKEAEDKGKAVSIAVVDTSGRLVAFYRMDGAHYASGDLARAKALTAIEFKTSTATIQEALLSDPSGIRILKVNATPVGGGMLLLRKQPAGIAGAIGIAGADDDDVGIATKGTGIEIK
jgi:glc operon protein GlcG